MKNTYTLESTNEILNGSKVEIRGKDQAEIDRKKAEVESRPVVVRLIPLHAELCQHEGEKKIMNTNQAPPPSGLASASCSSSSGVNAK